jgi:hypothetical protein
MTLTPEAQAAMRRARIVWDLEAGMRTSGMRVSAAVPILPDPDLSALIESDSIDAAAGSGACSGGMNCRLPFREILLFMSRKISRLSVLFQERMLMHAMNSRQNMQ